jgi:hypothetical protein
MGLPAQVFEFRGMGFPAHVYGASVEGLVLLGLEVGFGWTGAAQSGRNMGWKAHGADQGTWAEKPVLRRTHEHPLAHHQAAGALTPAGGHGGRQAVVQGDRGAGWGDAHRGSAGGDVQDGDGRSAHPDERGVSHGGAGGVDAREDGGADQLPAQAGGDELHHPRLRVRHGDHGAGDAGLPRLERGRVPVRAAGWGRRPPLPADGNEEPHQARGHLLQGRATGRRLSRTTSSRCCCTPRGRAGSPRA